MNGVDVLVMHGSPGSGKSTLARAIAEQLRTAGLAHGVIDLDDLSMVHPSPGRWFAYENLKAIWPNYAAVPKMKLLIPSVIADEDERVMLRGCLPGATFTVCELTAPEAVLKARVTARGPNEFWRSRLRDFVDLYHSRSDLPRIRDFQVSTHDRSVADAVQDVIRLAGWQR